jgi:hypothetical protein
MIGTNALGAADLGNGGSGIALTQATDTQIGGAAAGEGNVISGNGGWGIQRTISGNGVVIERNKIGTNLDGAAAIANALGGIVGGGGGLPGEPWQVTNNVVSGNGGDGIKLETASNRMLGNLIGTNASGSAVLGNAGHGVHLIGASNVVGGTAAGERNVISGNGKNGVLVVRARNEIVGNYVGTDLTGMGPIPNALSGMRFEGGDTADNTAVRNVVSANRGDGIAIANAIRVRLLGNLVGTAADGSTALGNGEHGILLEGSSGNVARNVVGGAEPADGNTVAFNRGHGVFIRQLNLNVIEGNRVFSNGGDGVAVVSPGGLGNKITRNGISSNAGLGIDLEDNGVTPNDPGDADFGANRLQNTPINLQVSADRTTVTGTLNSRPNRTYGVELFGTSGATGCDPSGTGEGDEFLVSTEVTTDGSGNHSFSVPLSKPLADGDVVTATATDRVDSDTSEFSQCAVPPPIGRIIIEKQTLPDGDPQAFCFEASYDPDGFCLRDGESNNSGPLPPGSYSVNEDAVEGWDHAATCSDGSPATAIQLAAGETVTCTFTNRKRGTVDLLKITNGVVRPDLDIKITLYQDGPDTDPDLTAGDTQLEELSTLGDADGLLQFQTKLVPDVLYTICENPVPAGWTSLWTIEFQVGGQIVTPYNPNGNDSPPQDLGIRCFDFTVDPAETKHFEVHNDFPGGEPRTIGYWKNWNRCTGGGQAANAAKNGGAANGFFIVEDVLPQLVGDLNITTCLIAVKILDKSDLSGKKRANDAAYELAAQLLAAKFNLAAGAETCTAVQNAVLQGQALLDSINFNGTGSYLTKASADRTTALSLAATLDQYNNGNLC